MILDLAELWFKGKPEDVPRLGPRGCQGLLGHFVVVVLVWGALWIPEDTGKQVVQGMESGPAVCKTSDLNPCTISLHWSHLVKAKELFVVHKEWGCY